MKGADIFNLYSLVLWLFSWLTSLTFILPSKKLYRFLMEPNYYDGGMIYNILAR